MSAPTTPEIKLTGGKALVRSLGILGTCIAQAPEFVQRRRRTGGDALTMSGAAGI